MANTKHDATGREIKKKTTRVQKGGYLGMMGSDINEFVSQLIWCLSMISDLN